MELIAASDPSWLGGSDSRRSWTDAEDLERRTVDSRQPFSVEVAGFLGDNDFNSPSATSETMGAVSSGGYLGFPDAHEALDETYPVDYISWTQSDSVSVAALDLQPSLFDGFGPFITGNMEQSSSEFQHTSSIATSNPERPALRPPSLPTDASPPNDASATIRRRPRTKPRLRRQNHACDPCRSSKKACDLPRGVSVRNGTAVDACTSCDIRDLDCTVSWLASRQLVRQGDKGDVEADNNNVSRCSKPTQSKSARAEETATPQLVDAPPQISGLDGDLSRQAVADKACLLKFNMYIDISDTYLSQCLMQGSMPLHFKFGIMAYDNLTKHAHLSPHVERVEQWVASCWNGCATETVLPMTPGPCILRAAGLLDALFSSLAPRSSRDTAITDAFRWVAIATAAQVNIGQSKGAESANSSRSRQRDFALASWRKAKELIFTNMAATKSFRLALALILFGHIVPPSGSAPHSQTDEDSEDRDYAYCEGTRRLNELCKQARNHITSQMSLDKEPRPTGGSKPTHSQSLSKDVCGLVLELIGSLEWLTCLSNSVAVGVSYGSVCPFPLETDGGAQPAISSSPPHEDGTPKTSESDDAVLLSKQSHQESLEAPILRRARRGGVSFIDVWRSNVHDSDAVLYAGRLPIALSALTWKFLARFSNAVAAVRSQHPHQNLQDVWRHYIAMISHIDLWRAAFGAMDHSLGPKLQISHREVWRIFSFCSVDTDLAILLFCDAVQKLEVELEGGLPLEAGSADELLDILRSTKTYRNEQRLISASQTAFISSTCQGPNDANLLQQPPTYGRYMCAHPNPWMLIQVHLLSIKAFSEEIKQLSMHGDDERVSDLKKGMNTCCEGLRELREVFCITPVFDASSIAW